MNIKHHLKNLTILLIVLFAVNTALGQMTKLNAPRQEKLLNGLKLLIWNEPSEKVSVKMRIHSGAAFDTVNKEGTMAMLADALFPNESVKEFFSEELGGSLEVTSNYDYIQINASGNATQILTILETISAAVTKPAIDKETTDKIRAVRLERIRELEKNPAYVADLAVSKRLFGSYPYGRSPQGTFESVHKVDFADLLLAKQRFLTADNATLAIAGNVKSDFVFKAVRQLFGAWEKADRKVPATFALPNAPDTQFFLIKTEINNASELRFAFRGASRKDTDFNAVQILTIALQNRLRKKDGEKVLFNQNSYFLPGFIAVKFSDWNASSLKFAGETASLPENFLDYVQELLAANLSNDEFQIARTEFLKNYNDQNAVDSWLDADTYNLAPLKNTAQNAQNTTLADVQKVLEKWRKEPVVRTLLYKAKTAA